ncbi:unnamed protein product [Chrysodeixis includens]|uniref:Lipase domain-containing protein n=1 Tax=Chrysodeixis includens TaxID=689277 RepID=A0A9P0BM60_CHRIL|nr:unnamed protein product [Chrysodeixis includens]
MLNVWKISVIVLSALQLTHSWRLLCYCGSHENPIEIPEDNLELFTNNPECFDLNRPTVIYTFGYKGGILNNGTVSILKAYIHFQDRNICALDWTELANEGIGLIDFPVISLKALALGRDFGELIVKLSDAGLNVDTLQLVGFSLGAHVLGETGRKVIENSKKIARITGLDPAKPQFDGPIPLPFYRRLDKTCAAFVDIIHSNTRRYGMDTPTGTIDFYPNYGEDVQPGCEEGIFEPFSPEELCSHDRSRDLMIQALLTPDDLQASKAPNYATWVKNDGAPIAVTTIGDKINKAYSGLLYLTTNAEAPYGKGAEGLKP